MSGFQGGCSLLILEQNFAGNTVQYRSVIKARFLTQEYVVDWFVECRIHFWVERQTVAVTACNVELMLSSKRYAPVDAVISVAVDILFLLQFCIDTW